MEVIHETPIDLFRVFTVNRTYVARDFLQVIMIIGSSRIRTDVRDTSRYLTLRYVGGVGGLLKDKETK